MRKLPRILKRAEQLRWLFSGVAFINNQFEISYESKMSEMLYRRALKEHRILARDVRVVNPEILLDAHEQGKGVQVFTSHNLNGATCRALLDLGMAVSMLTIRPFLSAYVKIDDDFDQLDNLFVECINPGVSSLLKMRRSLARSNVVVSTKDNGVTAGFMGTTHRTILMQDQFELRNIFDAPIVFATTRSKSDFAVEVKFHKPNAEHAASNADLAQELSDVISDHETPARFCSVEPIKSKKRQLKWLPVFRDITDWRLCLPRGWF
ncbi:MAG: hypothetical protein AAF198_04785 [Pseudomonadota bacterium]